MLLIKIDGKRNFACPTFFKLPHYPILKLSPKANAITH